LYDGNGICKLIQLHAASGHIGAFLLNLKSSKIPSLCLAPQENRNNAGASAQIQRPFPFFHPGKARKKNRIHAKTESSRILNDPVPVPLQLIQPLPFFQLNHHPVSISSPAFPEPPVFSAPYRTRRPFPFSSWAGISVPPPGTPESPSRLL